MLTIYNILPTITYYSNPLRDPIDAVRAENISTTMINRVNSLEGDSIDWIESFGKNLGARPKSVALNKDDPQLISVKFDNAKDAKLFRHFLARAGNLIPFVPAQLDPVKSAALEAEDPNEVLVTRQIAVRLDPAEVNNLFRFSPKYDENGSIAQFYREVIDDRVTELALAFGGPSKQATQLAVIVDNPTDNRFDDMAINLAKNIIETEKYLGKTNPILKRWYSSFSQIDRPDAKDLIQKYVARLKTTKTRIDGFAKNIGDEIARGKEKGEFATPEKEESFAQFTKQSEIIAAAISTIEKNIALFQSGKTPLTRAEITAALAKGAEVMSDDNIQSLSLEGRNPFVEAFTIDWDNDQALVKFYNDVESIRNGDNGNESSAYLKDKLNLILINDIARASSISDESINPSGDTFATNFANLTNTRGILTFNLGFLAEMQSEQIEKQLAKGWTPEHVDLNSENYPIRGYKAYQGESSDSQRLGLVVYSPAMFADQPPEGFRKGSIYVIAKGLNAIDQKYKQYPNSPESKQFESDLKELNEIMQQNGFIGYSGASYGIAPSYKNDYIFELDDYYGNMVKATREDFKVHGSKRFAVLDLTDVEQRLLARNKIEDQIQEDLLKWKEEYDQAQVNLDPSAKYMVPPPTKNPYWENFKLSAAKYVRGDDRKILKWGLDLSGGKTVRIGLRDQNNRPVTAPEDLNQAVNELYTRINKMGVSERTIRIENDNIILDFPGSQGLSAADLIKASAMYFHIVNEKFAPTNTAIREQVNEFLQNVWNEAVVTNRKDVESINEIAWKQLGGDETDGEIRPRGETAKTLYDNGLRFANPAEKGVSVSFDDTLSAIAMMRGEDFSEWKGQSHPLMVVFHNYALEGSSLTNVRVGYDPSKGNILTFEVKGSYDHTDGSPRNDFYQWTSQFAKDQIQGTAKETYTKGRGWRMAVILNDRVISQPTLSYPIRDAASIEGSFTQREIDQLAADLKAGSLSFTPHILSEQNVSPDLGREERTKGIVASLIALTLVVVAMVSYYRFAGVVASCAVLFNLLIMWGVLQNLGAALTLPGIAGIVLTIGMAVDANVLVFERIREEFKISGRIATAIQTGYRKAFSAIIDSNVTTILAAIILLQFDSGPIKGFAVTLIIGIVSSMFTALFMTRYYFAGWVKNPKNTKLSMAEFIGDTNIDFLKYRNLAFTASLAIVLVGSYLFVSQQNTMFGMDFTGGYSLTLEVQDQPEVESYRVKATDALLAAGISENDVDIRELSRPTQLRVQLGVGTEEVNQPFHDLPQTLANGKFTYGYESNPRLAWVVTSLQKSGIEIPDSQLEQLDKNWTVMSGQFSDSMRNNAIMALSVALVCILAYITLRFEFKYAVAAVVALTHDLLITLGILAFFHKLGFAVQINLEIVGALMTIIGYSLNDTIIIFDRIREDLVLYRKKSFSEIINHALNVTLTRTLMTSGTTLLVLFTLVMLGGKSIFGFSLVMTIGVIVGTLSSLFIASPVMLFIHNREVQQHEDHHAKPRKV